MNAVMAGSAVMVLLAFPAAAAGQGADQGYGGVIGDDRLVEQAPAPPAPTPPPQVPVVEQAPDVPVSEAPEVLPPEGPAPEGEVPVEEAGPTTRAPEEAEGGLPVTGSDVLPLLIGGLILVAMGAALRRRGHAHA